MAILITFLLLDVWTNRGQNVVAMV